jgi:ribosomal-protein-alanine N-acetyltransferase
MAVASISIPSMTGRLRPLDPSRDLGGVADLVELCFADAMDEDGLSYLRQMREAARSSNFIQWASSMAEQASLPFTGFVWEEMGRVVGNVSLIPFHSEGHRCYLIANVAVHPEYRGHGIGRRLTVKAMDYAQNHKAYAAWLQVREDNDPAIHIYLTLGFNERFRRTTWNSTADFQPQIVSNGLVVGPRRSIHWADQRAWLERLYPLELSWHLPLDWKAFRSDWLGKAYRLMTLNFPRHWAIQRSERLLGVLTWQRGTAHADTLWLATHIESEEGAIRVLILHARKHISTHRLLTLNYPAELAVQALRSAGFFEKQTLIWMEVKLT